jgi:hypothetical protein
MNVRLQSILAIAAGFVLLSTSVALADGAITAVSVPFGYVNGKLTSQQPYPAGVQLSIRVAVSHKPDSQIPCYARLSLKYQDHSTEVVDPGRATDPIETGGGLTFLVKPTESGQVTIVADGGRAPEGRAHSRVTVSPSCTGSAETVITVAGKPSIIHTVASPGP